MFIVKAFHELTTTELYAILRARTNVFVVEQNCAYEEVDGKDIAALHMFALQDGDVTAYLRMLPPGVSYEQLSIGRVLVQPAYRGQKLATALMTEALTVIEQHFGKQPIKIQAQTYLQAFYASFQFEAISESYLEDNIPHIDMLRR